MIQLKKKEEIRITETDWGFLRTESHVTSTDRHEQENGIVMWTRVLSLDSMLLVAPLNIGRTIFKEELTFRSLTCTQLLIRGVYITQIFVGNCLQKLCTESRVAPRVTTTSVFEMDADYVRRLSANVAFPI